MTTDSSSTDTAWSSVRTSAKDGQLMLEPGIAEKCARYVDSVLNSVVGVNNWVQNNYRLASPAIAHTKSGRELASIFGSTFGVKLPIVMDKHRGILTDMGNTFVAAGKQYASAEHESAVSFQGISFDDPSGTAPTGAPQAQPIPSGHSESRGTARLPVSIGPEDGYGFSWQQLYAIGQSIDPQAVANAAGVWYWLAGHLDENFSTLGSNIGAVAHQWTGNGATAAITATQNYVAAAKQLTGDMNKFGDTLLFTSQWLQQAKTSMPTTPDPPFTTGSGHTITATDLAVVTLPYQTLFNNHYAVPFPVTSKNIPALPEPDSPITPWSRFSGNSTPTTAATTSTGSANTPPSNSTSASSDSSPGTTTTSHATSWSANTPLSNSTSGSPNGSADTTTSTSPNTSSTSFADSTGTSPNSTTTALSPVAWSSNTSFADSTSTSPNNNRSTTTSTSPSSTAWSPNTPFVDSTSTSPNNNRSTTTSTSPSTTPADYTGASSNDTAGTTTSSGSDPSSSDPSSTRNPMNNLLTNLRSPAAASTSTSPGIGTSPSNKLANARYGPLSGLSGSGPGDGSPSTTARTTLERRPLDSLRSSGSAPEEEQPGRFGSAEERGPGMPMGGAPGAKKDQQNERKRSALLNSTEHLDEAIGEIERSIRPVLD